MTITKSLSTALIDGTGAITPANVTVSTNTMTVGTAMYVVANGNVGIGNSTPAAVLSITAPNNSVSPLYIGNTTTQFFALYSDGSTYHDGTQRVRKQGNTRFRSDRYINDQGAQLNAYDDTGNTYIPHYYGASYHYFLSGNSGNITSLFLSNTGNVGVGLTSPDTKLHVYGSGDPIIKCESSSANQAGQFSAVGNGSGSYPGFSLYQSTTNYWSMQMRADTNLYFYRQNGSGNVLIPNGNVGLGITPIADTKLSIGGVRARIALDSGLPGGTKARFVSQLGGWWWAAITNNWYYDGTDKQDDSSKPSWFYGSDIDGDVFYIGRSAAGSASLSGHFQINGSTGAISVPKGRITFPATQNVSTDANTLDDYEEGTWSPGIAFGGTGTTGMAISAGGSYTKVGRLVTCHYSLTMTTKGSSTGAAWLTGLPFSSNAGERGGGSVTYAVNFLNLNNPGQFQILMEGSGTTHVLRYFNGNSFTSNDLDNTHFQNGTQIWGQFSYNTTQ